MAPPRTWMPEPGAYALAHTEGRSGTGAALVAYALAHPEGCRWLSARLVCLPCSGTGRVDGFRTLPYALAHVGGRVKQTFRTAVNGDAHDVSVEPRTTLLECLRYELGLTGSKQGCDKGDCG